MDPQTQPVPAKGKKSKSKKKRILKKTTSKPVYQPVSLKRKLGWAASGVGATLVVGGIVYYLAKKDDLCSIMSKTPNGV